MEAGDQGGGHAAGIPRQCLWGSFGTCCIGQERAPGTSFRGTCQHSGLWARVREGPCQSLVAWRGKGDGLRPWGGNRPQGLCKGTWLAGVEGRWWQVGGHMSAGPHVVSQSRQFQPLSSWYLVSSPDAERSPGFCPGAHRGDIHVTYDTGRDFAEFSGGFWLSLPGFSGVLGTQRAWKDGLAASPST